MAAAPHNPNNVQPGTSRDGNQRLHSNRRHSKAHDDALHTEIQIDQSDAGSRAGTEVEEEILQLNHLEPETIPIYDIRLFNQQRRNRRYSASRSLPISLAVTPISELDTFSPLSSQWVIISEPRRAESTSLSYLSQRSTNTYNSATHFEDAFTKAGGFYNYQLRVLIVLCLASLYCGPSMMIWNFMQNVPKHRCQVQSDNSSTLANVSQFIHPQLDNLIPKKGYWSTDLDPCKKYDVSISSSSKAAVVLCDHFVFDVSKYSFMTTPAVSFEMVCQREWMWNASNVIFNVGILVGAVVFGVTADRFGRRPALLLALFMLTVSGISEVLVPDPKMYMVLVGFTGAGIVGTYQTAFILAMELVGSSQRRPVGFTFYIFFQFGYFISTFYVYFIRDWKLQKIALITPGLIFITYWWILPESAQWFLVKGKTKEAEEMLTRVAHVNKKLDGGSIVFENNKMHNSAKDMFILDSVTEAQKKSSSNSTSHRMNSIKEKTENARICTDLLSESQPRNSFIVIFIVMLLVGIGPKASRLYAIFKLYDNVYIEYLINGSLEIGGAFMGILFSPFFNRRQLFLVSSIIVSASFILMAILTIYDHWELFWIRIIIWKIFISTAVSNLRVMAAELFPTQARATLFSIGTVMMGIGEYINAGIRTDSKQKGFVIGNKDPFVFYGFASAAAGLLILLLPEMYNKPMPNTFADCKDFSSYDRDFPGLIKIMQKIHGAKQNQRVQEILEERRRESQAALKPRRKSRRPRTDGSSISGHESTDNSISHHKNEEFSRISTPIATPDGLKHSLSKSSIDTLDTAGRYSPCVEPAKTPTKETHEKSRPKSKLMRKGSANTSTFEMLEERKKKQREFGARLTDSQVNAKRKRKTSESESSFGVFETRDQQTQVMLENASLASLCENDL
uniref:Major facilitator superfamily (MFS) profile domain-containing protein n=1 Tax=Strigamia maritima TaxID=126957 RepID=T1IQS2_STRMM